MVWHIKKTSILGQGTTVYYKGNNCWTDNYDARATYSSQKNAKAENYIWEKVDTASWDVTTVNEG